MFCDKDNNEWDYIPVETADEIMFEDMTECKRLKNWKKWLKIRKQQNKLLGLKVCRSPTSTLMNESDKFRSKVERRWTADIASKLRANREHTGGDFPYSMAKETRHFSSVHTPDVVRAEKGTFVAAGTEDERGDFFGTRPADDPTLREELQALGVLRPAAAAAGSPGKLAVVGENIFRKTTREKSGYKGPIPSIRVEHVDAISNVERDRCDDDGDEVVIVRVNDTVCKFTGKICEFETLRSADPADYSTGINAVKLNEDFRYEFVLENRSRMSVRYEWKRENERTVTGYDLVFAERQRPIGCFYFDTRPGVLGPGQVERLTVLFRPKTVGTHRETWLFLVDVSGMSDNPVIRIQVPLRGCAVSDVDNKAFRTRLQTTITHETANVVCSKLATTIFQNAFSKGKSFHTDKYQYHEAKMKYLYSLFQTEKPMNIEELLCQCMRLEQSFCEKLLDVISQTAIVLLKRETIFGSSLMTYRELNAHKTVYIAMDCIDLIMNTYEPDYEEVCHELEKNLIGQKKTKKKKNSGNEVSVDRTMKLEQMNSVDNSTIREEWLDIMKPMIHKRLEWVVDRICEYNILWTECAHGPDDTEHS